MRVCIASCSVQNDVIHEGRIEAQSPQLRESDPTFWILNAVQGVRAASPAPTPAPALVVPSAAYQPLS